MTTDVLSPVAAAPSTAPAPLRSRWHWRNWPVVVKLAAVLLVPTLVALVAGVLRIVDQAGAAPGYARISQVVGVQQQLSDLIGAVQRERHLATAFVATGREGDQQPLTVQFRAVDSASQVVRAATDRVAGLESTGYRSILAQLGALGPLRTSVTTGFGPVEAMVTEYSAALDSLVELDAALTRQLDDVAVTNDAAAEHALVSAREQISRQHAIISAALYTNVLTPGQIEDVRTASVKLATEQDAFRGALPPAERDSGAIGAATGATVRAGVDAEQSRLRLLQLVLNRGLAAQPLNTAPAVWDSRTAVVIDNIAASEKELRQRIDRTALELRDQVRTIAGLNSVILFFALGLGVLVGIVIARAFLRPLGVLKRTALDIADRRLPEAMARIRDGDDPDQVIVPVAVSSREEIGQVARAFDEVHSQAVRLAGEQAQLRSNVNDIFVNLSRRTQGLVERQLKLIDRLESGEQDPEQLDNLFQLDHLATRMRRNSENLLVLAGNEAANRSGRPVRLVDVLRAAVSEVEQYQRLVLQQPPTVLVLGRAAGDLVHLLAELLDNATQFSPPDSQVMLSSNLAPDSSVVVEVADRGVGMTDAEFAKVNERLASPPLVDASVSRRMGLFVVSRLAARHGIDVRLRRGEGGVGVWAAVIMPSRLVRAAPEVVDLRAAVSEVATGNGSARREPAPLPAVTTGRNGVLVPRPDAKLIDGPGTNGNGGPGTNGTGTNGTGAPETSPAASEDSPDDSAQLLRTGKRPAPAGPPPAPPGPPASPPVDMPGDIASTESSADLFRPAQTMVAGPAGPGHRVTLQHSTPIFDDVASAWFKEHEAVPVRWTAPAVGGAAASVREAGPAREVGTTQETLPRREAPAATQDALPRRGTPAATQDALPRRGTPAATQDALPRRGTPAATQDALPRRGTPAATQDALPRRGTPAATQDALPRRGTPAASAAAGSSALIRRQPGKALAESGLGAESGFGAEVDSGDAGKPRSPVPPASASETTRPAGAPAQDWGAADDGWRAAEALAMPVSAEFTVMGLPRRQPRALLVPGAAGPAEPEPAATPVRSAESIRSRLASYQQGVREGRQIRRNLDQDVDESLETDDANGSLEANEVDRSQETNGSQEANGSQEQRGGEEETK